MSKPTITVILPDLSTMKAGDGLIVQAPEGFEIKLVPADKETITLQTARNALLVAKETLDEAVGLKVPVGENRKAVHYAAARTLLQKAAPIPGGWRVDSTTRDTAMDACLIAEREANAPGPGMGDKGIPWRLAYANAETWRQVLRKVAAEPIAGMLYLHGVGALVTIALEYIADAREKLEMSKSGG